MDGTDEGRAPEPGAFRREDRLRSRPHPAIAGGAAGALVDLLRDGNLDVAEDVVFESRHFRRGSVGDEDARLELLALRARDLGLALVLEPLHFPVQRSQARCRILAGSFVGGGRALGILCGLDGLAELLAPLLVLLFQSGDGLRHRLPGSLVVQPARVAPEGAADVFP